MDKKIIAIAPMQGYTDAPFRHFHSLIYGERILFTAPRL